MILNAQWSASKTRVGTALLSFLLILAFVLAACGTSSTTSNSSTNTTNSVLTVVPSPIGDFTRDFSPYTPNAAYGTLGMIYETLLFFNRENGNVQPWLASSYQFSSDATHVTFNLRQGVKWSDGQPLTSADVVFTLNMLKQYPAADGNGLWNVISTVSAPDANSVLVTLKKPYSPILWYLGGQTYIVPQHLWSNVGDPTKYANANPVGTGPFVLKSFTPQLIDLGKNPHYWQPGKPAVSEIRYPSFNSNTSAELLLARNGVDWTGLFTPNIQQTFVNRDSAHNHYWFPPANVVMLYLNTAKYPFNLLPVRQAISTAIDRDQLYKVGESGYEPPASPTGLVLPANQNFLASQYSGSSFSIDSNKSAQLLASAGFTKGSDGIYADKNGKKLSFSLDVVTGWTDWVTDCQIMANNLKAIGMNVTVNPMSFNAYYSALQMGSFDMAISWTNPGPTPYFLYQSLLNSQNTAAVGKAATSNFERWSDPKTDQLLSQYANTTDSTTQQQALNGIQQIMVEQLPSIPLVYGATWYEYNTSHFTGWPDQNNTYAVPSPFTFPDAEVVVLNLHPVA
ncbi:MAG TPA: ABC transporter substrate-binding protein [Ktedonobacteraceae bacterium]|nr:ABC transporter substrate-binding protein [Ktedonobacteraceae bacterium]